MTPLKSLAASVLALLLAAADGAAQERNKTFDDWVRDPMHTTNGQIRVTGLRHDKYVRAYRCAAYENATFVIATVEKSRLHEKTAKGQRGVLLRVLAAQNCQPAAKGDYLPLELGPSVWINLGYEADEDWTALRVKAPDGTEAGLVFDASVYAMD